MQLHAVDIAIVVAYFVAVIVIGLWVSRRGTKNIVGYTLASRSLPWYRLGVSDASGMYDVSGTMWQVYAFFIYGVKSIWLPFVWPVFNQIFLMVFMSAWTRRSRVLTGAEWIETRFGRGRPAVLSHLSMVAYAIVSVIALLAYAFKGIGKFAVVMLPWHFTGASTGMFSDENIYAIILMGMTAVYAIKGGMISVVVTEMTQFAILAVSSVAVGLIAAWKVSPEMIRNSVPAGWMSPFFGWKLNLDWSGILASANDSIRLDGNEFFMAVILLMAVKGVLASLAGPAPDYDMQRILATRSPREASLMSAWVNVVLLFPSYVMSTGITLLALGFCLPQLRAMATPDFEKILPIVLANYIPVGVLGIVLAGFISAFMANFSATLNAAPAYLVNDIYKRFFNPGVSGRTEVNMCRVASILILAVGIVFGLVTTRIIDIMMWLAGALGGGYVMPNLLKWYWWRFNGYGYFWGMISGIVSSMVAPLVTQRIYGHDVSIVYSFPAIFACSTIGCLLGTFLTPPDEESVLLDFYRTVRPWGAWGPIRERVTREIPDFPVNRDCARDWVNITVGIVWQLCLVTTPIYLVMRTWPAFWISAAIIAGASIFLKFNWYDRLEAEAPEPRENTFGPVS